MLWEVIRALWAGLEVLLLEKPLGVWQQVTDKVAWGANREVKRSLFLNSPKSSLFGEQLMMLPIHFKSCRDPYSCMVVFVTKMTNPQRVGMLSLVVREL